MDFANDSEVIRKAFQDFYEDTELIEGSDPDKLYDFRRSMEEYHYYTQGELNRFAEILFTVPFRQEQLPPILDLAIRRFKEDTEERRDKFRALLKSYVRVYAFLSQIISFRDVELEKLYVYGRILLRKLPYEKVKLPKEVTQQVDLDSLRIQYSSKGIKLKEGEGGKFIPGEKNPAGEHLEFIEPLSQIIKDLNERFATEFSEEDKVVADNLLSRVGKDAEFEAEVKTNPKENVFWAFQKKFDRELQEMIEQHFDFYKKVNDNKQIKDYLLIHMFETLYDRMRQRAG